MRILLINIDSTYPNLALKKLEKYHTNKGDFILWNHELSAPKADKIYVSCINDWNKSKAKEFEKYPQAEIGGSGYSIKKTLPPEIDKIKLRINVGFTTRGCIRNCEFCIVPKKEGKIKAVGDIYDVWDGKSKTVMLWDNNILALPEHFKKICSQIKKENIRINFVQGLDCRLLTNSNTELLSTLKHDHYYFSFDNMKDEKTVLKGIELLKKHNLKRSIFYVLVGFNTTIEEDLHRLYLLRDNKQNAYIMRYRKKTINDRRYIALERWVNKHSWFWKTTFREYIRDPKNNYEKEFTPSELSKFR